MHAADCSVDGRAWIERSRRILVSPLRRSADRSRPGQADRHRMEVTMRTISILVAGIIIGIAIESGLAQQGRVVGLNHVAVSVSDYKGAIDFYGRQMGF